MDFKRLFELLIENPENISIEYSNINGKERMVVNGEDLTNEEDDSEIKELVSRYKENIEAIDACTFLEILDEMKDHIDIKTFDELLNQETYSEEDAEILRSMISFANMIIYNHLSNRIQDLQEIIDNL